MRLYDIEWEQVAKRLFFMLRLFFLATLSWEFFLTITTTSSVRYALFHILPPLMQSAIVIVWVISLLGLLGIFLNSTIRHEHDVPYINTVAYLMVMSIVVVNVVFIIMAFISGNVVATLLMSHGVNVVWGICLIYARKLITYKVSNSKTIVSDK